MNQQQKTALIVGLAVLFGAMYMHPKPRPVPSDGVEAVAEKSVKQFAASLADIAEEIAEDDPNEAAKALSGKVKPAFDAAWKPINEAIDKAIAEGNYRDAMIEVSKGYRRASK